MSVLSFILMIWKLLEVSVLFCVMVWWVWRMGFVLFVVVMMS